MEGELKKLQSNIIQTTPHSSINYKHIFSRNTMNVGAVVAMRYVKSAISVARMVLEHTSHSILAGEKASNFAKQMGFKEESLTTNKSIEIWQKWKSQNCQPNFWQVIILNHLDNTYKLTLIFQNDSIQYISLISVIFQLVNPDPRTSCGPYTRTQISGNSLEHTRDGIGPDNHDTIGMVAIDKSGNIAAGTSTNGATHKIPG